MFWILKALRISKLPLEMFFENYLICKNYFQTMNFPKKLCLRLFCEIYTWVLVVLGYDDCCSGWGGGGGGGDVLVVVVVVVVVVKFAVGLAVVISLGVLACFT